MYAIIRAGGKQSKVSEGDVLDVERLKATGEVTVLNNSIYDNAAYALYNDASFTVNAASNWWGVATTNEMNAKSYPSNIAKIYDSFDDPGLGFVAYTDWLLLYEIPYCSGKGIRCHSGLSDDDRCVRAPQTEGVADVG